MDEPIGDQALLPVILLSKEAAKYVKVVLGGEGADEIFGGYSYYEQFSKKKPMKYFFDFLNKENDCFLNEEKHETSSGFPLLTNEFDRLNLIKESEHKAIKKELFNFPLDLQNKIRKIKDKFKRAQYSDVYSWLEDDLLIKYDRMSMAASLEGRAPYLDSSLAEYAFNLPMKFKWRSQSKYILREAFRYLLPEKVYERRKQGFILPMSEWLRTALKGQLLDSTDFVQDDLIDNEYYKKMVQNHISKKEDRGRLLYSIFVYKLWYKKFIKTN
jgi:asparagine synthase (glutamine-hydrolysing)